MSKCMRLHIEGGLENDNFITLVKQGLHGGKKVLRSAHCDGNFLQGVDGALDKLTVVVGQSIHKRQVA